LVFRVDVSGIRLGSRGRAAVLAGFVLLVIAGLGALVIARMAADETVLGGGLWRAYVDVPQLESAILTWRSMRATRCRMAGS